MFVPNKTVSLSESILAVSAKLLPNIKHSQDIFSVYTDNNKLFKDLPEYIDALSLLFLLGRIDINLEKGTLEIA